jgi:GNAT superfamily N-acetyltransferase
MELAFHPLTAERWADFEELFGPRGACAGCWCMYWRLKRAEFNTGKGEGNRRAMLRLVRSGEVPGLLAYDGKKPVGWCSVAPREQFSALGRSKILRPVDEQAVWSVVCFYIAKPYRRRGVTVLLLGAAADYARSQGAGILEGYPVEPREGKTPDVFAYTGLASAFRGAGFEEVARRSATRPIMRQMLEHLADRGKHSPRPDQPE